MVETYEDDLTEWYWHHQKENLTHWLCIERVLDPGEEGKDFFFYNFSQSTDWVGGWGRGGVRLNGSMDLIHTLLTFPLEAFQRQYNNNLKLLKNSKIIFRLKIN